jgi:CheY-like chemotaxis protein
MTNRLTILLADDNRLDALLLARAFQRAGTAFRVVTVHDGVSVLKYLKGEADYADRKKYPLPRLLLLDTRMPGLDGFEVLKWKQQQLQFSQLPVVIIGDCMSSESVLQAYRFGANCVLGKSHDLEQLADGLLKFIEHCVSILPSQRVRN